MDDDKSCEEIPSLIRKYKSDLRVKRLPEPWLAKFKKLADDDFASDYGMTIIFLYRYYIDDVKYTTLLQAMEELKVEVDAAFNTKTDARPKLLDGRRLGDDLKDEK